MRRKKLTSGRGSRHGRLREEFRRAQGRKDMGRILQNQPDGETQCESYVTGSCTIYRDPKKRKRMCPGGLGYFRQKGENKNNWPPCDAWRPYDPTEKKKED